MSAHSFPSLTSDSSSIPSRTSDTHLQLAVKDLRNRVSKLEQEKFVLGDYAPELQSRERMEIHDTVHSRDKAQSPPLNVALPLFPASQSGATDPISAPTLTLTRASSLSKTSSLTPKLRLVSKRSSCQVSQDVAYTAALDPAPILPQNSLPTRRRLQAMCGRTSFDTPPPYPSVNGEPPSSHDSNDQTSRSALTTRIYNSVPSRGENARHGAKRPALFTSKLDSIVVTSKLFPLSSSRSKPPPDSLHTDPDPDQQNDHPTVAPPPPTHSGQVNLDSPPKQSVKINAAQCGNKSLSHSLGLEENHASAAQSRNDDRKSMSRGRVSFSERLFSSSTDRPGEMDTDKGGLWGSWGRKSRPPVSSSRKDERMGLAPYNTTSAVASQFAKSGGESRRGSNEKRHDKRRSLAAGCLRFVTGSSQRDTSFTSEPRASRVLRRSHSESRKSRSHSRSRSPPPDHVRRDYGIGAPWSLTVKDKDDAHRITPSRVGSPKLKGRVSDPQHAGGELERADSLRSAGKWGNRGRAFSYEFTRRRTIHPMFSFERPGSAAASTSSSRRADDGDAVDGHRAEDMNVRETVEKPSRRTRRAAQVERGPSSSQHRPPPHVQDDSGASGHTAMTLARSESLSTSKGKSAMMHTRLGVKAHGTFEFEPAATVVIPPRSAPPGGSFARDVKPPDETHLHASDRHMKAKSEPATGRRGGSVDNRQPRAYFDFCDDLKAVLGDSEEWASFIKYVRRFDIGVLAADGLLRRVKKLIDGSRTADQSTKSKLYERFANIVQDTIEKHVLLSS